MDMCLEKSKPFKKPKNNTVQKQATVSIITKKPWIIIVSKSKQV